LSYERWTTSSNDTWGRWDEANRLRGRLTGGGGWGNRRAGPTASPSIRAWASRTCWVGGIWLKDAAGMLSGLAGELNKIPGSCRNRLGPGVRLRRVT